MEAEGSGGGVGAAVVGGVGEAGAATQTRQCRDGARRGLGSRTAGHWKEQGLVGRIGSWARGRAGAEGGGDLVGVGDCPDRSEAQPVGLPPLCYADRAAARPDRVAGDFLFFDLRRRRPLDRRARTSAQPRARGLTIRPGACRFFGPHAGVLITPGCAAPPPGCPRWVDADPSCCRRGPDMSDPSVRMRIAVDSIAGEQGVGRVRLGR